MGAIWDAFKAAFRDWTVDGLPSSGEHEPEKTAIRALGKLIEDQMPATDVITGQLTEIDGRLAVVEATVPATLPGDPLSGVDQPDMAWSIEDETGRRALAIGRDGTAWIGGHPYPLRKFPYQGDDIGGRGELAVGLAGGAGTAVGISEDGYLLGVKDRADDQPLAYTKQYLSHETIYLVDGAGETRLTDGTINAYSPVVRGNSYVAYRSDRDGTMREWRATLDGAMDLPRMTGILEHHIFYGQSNGLTGGTVQDGAGTIADPGAVRAKKALVFNGGFFPNFADPWAWDAPIPRANLATLEDLVVGVEDSENHGYGFAKAMPADRLLLLSNHSVGGAFLAELTEGTQPFDNIVDAVRAGYRIAESLGLRYSATLHMHHGESDGGPNQIRYYLDFIRFKAALNRRLAAVGTNADGLRALITQIVSSGIYDLVNPSTNEMLNQQLRLHEDGHAVLVCPTYHLPHDQNEAIAIHYPAYGYRWIAEKEAAVEQAIAEYGSWDPLRPSSIVASGTRITVSFAGLYSDLVLAVYDATLRPNDCSNPGNYGFELYDSGRSITAVSLSPDKTQVYIDTNIAVTAAAELAYAWTANAGSGGGPLTGARGCVRDSDGPTPTAELQAYRMGKGQTETAAAQPLWNHLVGFRKPVTLAS